MTIAHNLGFPAIGALRELKRATESYWTGKLSQADLLKTGAELRARHWRLQQDAGLDLVPCNDFSYYDRVLDACALVGAVPARYGRGGDQVDLDTYFAMARGSQGKGRDAVAMEMTKWFDTNYHYIVPELEPGQTFRLASTKPVDALLPVYGDVLGRLAAQGAQWIQLDEPMLALDRTRAELEAYRRAYGWLADRAGGARLLVATYFAGLDDNLDTALALPTHGLHVDLVRAPGQFESLLKRWTPAANRVLSLGAIDGRNVWRADLQRLLPTLERARDSVGPEHLWLAPSCSLLHVPIDLALEKKLDPEIRGWLAYAKQKLEEVVALRRALDEGAVTVAAELDLAAYAANSRRTSPRIHDPAVKQRVAGVTERDLKRTSPHTVRRGQQVRLPLYPTTTIGSFPQTAEVRKARKELGDGTLSREAYERFVEEQIDKTIQLQEQLGLDVPVHGEFERNDMVEYFGEQLRGFAFTEHGWVQSYGSRYVKPPIIYGDVARPKPMTVRWSRYAQSRSAKPVKGMLTGPVTILQWSFVRDDQPRAETARQLAMAIRDEVRDLEAAGIRVIQIDEPALREGLPLRRADWTAYLDWAVNAFRLATAGVSDATQIHTHMCYSEFNEVLRTIERMDADVISIENARSGSELVGAFREYKYPNEIGPGVYDIHSPRVPSTDEIVTLLRAMRDVLEPRQIWVNPDCGLKTRRWEEVLPSLEHMVAAAKTLRAEAAAPALKTAPPRRKPGKQPRSQARD